MPNGHITLGMRETLTKRPFREASDGAAHLDQLSVSQLIWKARHLGPEAIFKRVFEARDVFLAQIVRQVAVVCFLLDMLSDPMKELLPVNVIVGSRCHFQRLSK